MREKQLFDFGWLFHKGEIQKEIPKVKGPIYTAAKTERKKWGPASIHYNDHPDDFRHDVEFNSDKWVNVNLPHDYVIEGTPKEENNPALGFFDYENAWYRKHFTLKEEDKSKRITLYFEGVASRCTVYLNGCELYHNFCGYTSFEVDITDYVKFEQDNALAVHCTFDSPEGWWYQGGGIYRHVWLCKTDFLAVDLYGVYVAPQKVSDSDWKLNFETTLVNEYYENVSATVVSKVLDKEGNLVSSASSEIAVAVKDKGSVKYFSLLKDPKLWDLDNPYQYTLETNVILNGNIVDTYFSKFGCRSFYFDANNGLFINGKQVVVKGVCGHGDFGLTGKAVPDNIYYYKAKLMKEMGANGYRTAHYPQAEAMMDALDDLGFVVMSEARWFDSSEEGKKQLAQLIKRDRNRPSVFMWSLGNEEPHHITDEGRRINASLFAVAKKLDKFRPLTCAVSISPDKATVFDGIDLIGINYNHWLYDDLRCKYPAAPIYASECCATGTTRGWYFADNEERAYLPAYDRDTNSWFTGREHFWKMFKARPWMWGAYQWIAFEHRGEAMWPRVCSQAGAIDLFMQKKDAFYQNQSHWLETPMIHLLPHWNWRGREGEKITVFAYTNTKEAELFLNGKSLGKQQVEDYTHLEWNVEYEPGILEVVGYFDGKEVARKKVQTSNKATKLKLRLENDPPKANGQDIAVLTCYCVDENGIEVPDATPFVSFHCNELGKVIGTGSDVSDHTPVTSPNRKMRAGAIGIAVKVSDKAGTLKVYATSENLESCSLSIQLEK